jgi:HAMP domain-containing protein
MDPVVVNQLTQIETAAISALITVLTVAIGAVATIACKFIATKRDEAVSKMGVQKWNDQLEFAKQIWGVVDEHFRINTAIAKTVESTSTMFADEMRKKFPMLTDDEVKQLQQAVAGAVNQCKSIALKPVK